MKYLSIDTETTGLLECKNASVIEFAAILDDLKKPLPIDRLPFFHCYVSQEEYTGQPYALQMNSEILKRIAIQETGYLYLKPHEVGEAFKTWLEKNSFNRKCDHVKNGDAVLINAAGKNFASFDKPFLNRLPLFEENVQSSSRVLDPAIYYMQVDDFRLPDMKTCLQRANLNDTVIHTAVDDAKQVIRLIRRALKIAPESVNKIDVEDVLD